MKRRAFDYVAMDGIIVMIIIKSLDSSLCISYWLTYLIDLHWNN